MTWRVVAASAIGSAHIANGGSCQDSCWAAVDGNPPALSIFVADGAGSALHGGEGAEFAIQAAASFVARVFSPPAFTLTREVAVECVSAVRAHIAETAQQQGLTARDYACTFLGVLSSSCTTLLMQIGDGGIVLDVGNGLELPIAPMCGEYANMTHFVTDEDAIDVLAVKVFASPAHKTAVFTDGIQRLALNLTTNTVHEPFFAPFFKVLAASTAAQEEQLQSSLGSFLNSAPVNERTDDDKTLALAVRVE